MIQVMPFMSKYQENDLTETSETQNRKIQTMKVAASCGQRVAGGRFKVIKRFQEQETY